MIYVALLYSLIFVSLLIFLQFLSRYTINSKVYRNGLIILILMLSFVAYNYIPVVTDDLYRYYIIMDRMRDRSVEWGLFSSAYAHEPFSNILFLLVAKLTNNNAIYQTVAILLIYGMFFLNMKKVTGFQIKKEENLYFITFLSFTILLYAISGTRNTLAALFFAYGLYNETDKITKKSLVFYILSVCTHIGLLPIVIIRLLCVLLPPKRFSVVHILLLCWSMMVGVITNLFSDIDNEYIQLIIKKTQFYIYSMNNQEADIRYVLAMFILCILLVIIYFIESNVKSSYTNFMGYLIFMTLGCFVSPFLADRYLRVVCACILPMFMDLRKQKWAIKNIVMYAIAVLDIGMLSFQVVMFTSHFSIWFK